MKIIAAILAAAFLTACTNPHSTASIRPGIGSDVDLNALNPPSGAVYQFGFEQNGKALPGLVYLKSRKLGARRYSYNGDFIFDVQGAGNLEEGVRFVADLLEAPGIRAKGSRVFIPVRLRTDNRFRATAADFLSGRSRMRPHDCFAVLGACRYTRISSDGERFTIAVDTSETGGVWTSVHRFVDADAPPIAKRYVETSTYSLDENGVMIDRFTTAKGFGRTVTTAFRRRIERTPS